jgi:hypothetical protein
MNSGPAIVAGRARNTGRFGMAFCLALVAAGNATSATAADRLLERHLGDRYQVMVQYGSGEMHRTIYPKFPVEIPLTGSDGRTYTLRQPFELYTESRRYLPAAGMDAAYEDAYAQLVANGDCLPVYAGFREASFDCGDRQGMRTIAVRSDTFGLYLSSEMTASALIPDTAEFATARDALDDLTSELESRDDSAPADTAAPD